MCRIHNARISAAHLGNTTKRTSHDFSSSSRTRPSTGSGQGSTSWRSGIGGQGGPSRLSSFKRLHNIANLAPSRFRPDRRLEGKPVASFWTLAVHMMSYFCLVSAIKINPADAHQTCFHHSLLRRMLRHRAACYLLRRDLACPISVLPSRLTQECYGAGRLVTARCYGVDSENPQCFRALLRCYGVRPQGGGGPKLCRKLCRPPLSTSPVLLTTSRRQPLRSRVIQSDPEQSRLKILLDNQHPTRKNKGQLK